MLFRSTHPNLRLDAFHHSGSQLYRKNADSPAGQHRPLTCPELLPRSLFKENVSSSPLSGARSVDCPSCRTCAIDCSLRLWLTRSGNNRSDGSALPDSQRRLARILAARGISNYFRQTAQAPKHRRAQRRYNAFSPGGWGFRVPPPGRRWNRPAVAGSY